MNRLLVVALLFVLAVPRGTLALEFEQGRFEVQVEEIAEDIHVIRRAPSWRFWVQANAVLIVNEADAVVIDGGGHPAHVDNVIAAIKRITDKPVSLILTTHWHQDHNFGVHLYRDHYPDVRVVSHTNTRKVLADRGNEDLARVQEADYGERLAGLLEARLQGLAEAGADERVIAFYEDSLDGADEVVASFKRAQNGLADETFDRRMIVHRPGRAIEFLYFGRANTNGDAIAWLPDEKIVITGDVVVRPTPYGFGSYPREWVETLNKIQELDYDILVPGHGDIQHDGAYVQTLMDLIASLSQQTEEAVAAGADSVDALQVQVDFHEFDRRLAGGDPLLQHLFLIWFKRPILQAAYEQATGQ